MLLDLDDVRRRLGDGYRLEYYAEIDSTNDRALQLARGGEASGALVVADFQSAGRGRRGAAWTAPPGSSVLCSLLVRPVAALSPPQLAILSAVGVAGGLRRVGAEVHIKWPNDLLLAGRKVAGILLESTGGAVVIGIGVNCDIPWDAFPPEVRARAGSLRELLGRVITREEVLVAVVHGVAEALAQMAAEGSAALIDNWNTLNWLARRKIRVSNDGAAVEGNGLYLDRHKPVFQVITDSGVVVMPLTSSVEVR